MKAYLAFWAVVPICIHFLVANITVLFVGNSWDAVARTTVTAGMLIPVFWYLYKRDIGRVPERKKVEASLWSLGIIFVLGAIASQVVSGVMDLVGIGRVFSNETQESLYMGNAFLQILGLGIAVPIMEELLFRGLVYNRLKAIVPSKPAVVLGASIFALYHGNMMQIIFALPMAFLLIFVYEKWGSLRAPILFHMGANLSAVILTMIFS